VEESPDFLSETTFALTEDEGSFVRELILQHAKDSFLAFLCASGSRSSVMYPWLHPRRADAPSGIVRQLEFAQSISALMQGASILYNLLLAERRHFTGLADALRDGFEDWIDDLGSELASFEWDEFWQVAWQGNPRISSPTRSFVEGWASAVLDLGGDVVDDVATRRLIQRRERQTKHAQARLVNPRRLETWTEPVGMGRLGYRWPVVQDIVNDIVRATRR
jgi:hypothetical protein